MSEKRVRMANPEAAFVKRARLIRRKTTNVYGRIRDANTNSKSSEEEEVISQILIIKLKPIEEATTIELSAMNGFRAPYIPYIFYANPPFDENRKPLPAPLFFPDFSRPWKRNIKESVIGPFSVILTDDRGTRTFASCYKYKENDEINEQLSLSQLEASEFLDNCVLVITSMYPAEILLSSLAKDFVSSYRKNPSTLEKICQDLLHLRLTNSVNALKQSKYIVPSYNTDCFSRTSLVRSLARIGAPWTAYILLSLLAERRVVITGENIIVISEIVQMFTRLLAPLQWPHTLIPVLPDTHHELLSNPTPYLYGLMRYNLNLLKNVLCPGKISEEIGEIIILDVDQGILSPYIDWKKSRSYDKAVIDAGKEMGFSKSIVENLLTILKSAPKKTTEKVENKMMIWYAGLFGHYKRFISNGTMSAKNRKLFVAHHPVPETRKFLLWFTESGLFQAFIYSSSHAQPFVNPMEERFEKILEKHAPPIKEKGAQNRARVLVYRFLHG